MAFDLGDPIPLATTVRNASGVPENATTVVLTITLPDLTTVTPAVTGTVGAYTTNAPYVATLAGRHAVRWVATGTNACATTDVFNVQASDPGQLISLADARIALGTQPTNTVKDEDLRAAISDATPIMEDLCGPILRVSRVETYDGGASKIVLLYSPIISISSMLETYGNNVRTLTLQDPFAGTGQDGYGYTVDLASGIVTRRSAGVARPFALGRRNVQVTYISGRALIGGNILRATRLLVRQLWLISGQQGNRPQLGTPDTSIGSTPSGFAVPNAVLEMVGGADTRAPGRA